VPNQEHLCCTIQ